MADTGWGGCLLVLAVWLVLRMIAAGVERRREDNRRKLDLLYARHPELVAPHERCH